MTQHAAQTRRSEHRAGAARSRANTGSRHLNAQDTPDLAPPVSRCACGGGCPQCDTGKPPSRPLESAARTLMESSFGRDFSHVRLRVDADAARAHQARAFTHGSAIVFDAGAYAPSTPAGQHLLA